VAQENPSPLDSINLTMVKMHHDWANLARYDDKNKEVLIDENDRVVFIGNSITEGWKNKMPDMFDNQNFINRGISGQTTPQILVRFRTDVIDLKPNVVVILAGTNDVAGNTPLKDLETVTGNLASMAELARHHNIKVILCSVLPA
jgi:lysophospholipase L1-like esterase